MIRRKPPQRTTQTKKSPGCTNQGTTCYLRGNTCFFPSYGLTECT
jgi:hypothetical protein